MIHLRYAGNEPLPVIDMSHYDPPLWSPQTQSEQEMIDWLEYDAAQDWVIALLKLEREDFDLDLFLHGKLF